MSDHVPVIYRSPSEVAEYLATHKTRIGAGARIIGANSIRARLTQDKQDRIDRMIHATRDVYDPEELRTLGQGGHD